MRFKQFLFKQTKIINVKSMSDCSVCVAFYIAVLTVLIHVKVESSRPHIVFILADDLGWDDVSFHGSSEIPTPNLDSLAYDGILLSNYYVQPICTPTRGSLLTGRHPIHTSLQHGVIVSSQPYGLPLNETIMPQYLKKLGYKSHIVGKWHLGFYTWAQTPTRRGFDSHYGYYQGMEDYWDHTYEFMDKDSWGLDFRHNDDIIKSAFGQYSTHLFTNEAERIIQGHDSNQPLYLYLPFQAVHSANPWKPLEVPWEYYEQMRHIKDDKRRTFAAMVRCLDEAVGNITKALYTKGILNNTIIVFSTDNGGPAAGFDMNYASNSPLRGVKTTLWEGGVKGTGFIWSPLLRKSGYTFNYLMQVIDWLPTLLSAAGYDMDKLPENIDGMDLWPSLNALRQKSLRTAILHNIDPIDEEKSLRVNDMKIVISKRGNTLWYDQWYKSETNSSNPSPSCLWNSTVEPILRALGRPKQAPHPVIIKCDPNANGTSCNPSVAPCVFNITADPCEYNNLAGSLPHVVRKLLYRLHIHEQSAVQPANKPIDPAGLPKYHSGAWVPWMNDSNGWMNVNIL